MAAKGAGSRGLAHPTWSQALRPTLAAAATAAESGIAADVIDLRSLWPWDADAVARSVGRTRRLLVVQEGGRDGGFGSDVIAVMIERLGPQAFSAVRQLGAPRLPVPFSTPLEREVLLHPARILDAMRSMMTAAKPT